MQNASWHAAIELKNQLANQDVWPWLLPEVILLVGTIALLLTATLNKASTKGQVKWPWATASVLLASAIASAALVPEKPLDLAHGMLQISPFAAGIRTLTAFASLLSLLLVRPREELEGLLTEKLYLMLSMVLGLNLLCLSSNILTAYLGLEIASISAWVLAGFAWTSDARAAAMRYFIFGTTASGLMVFGASWLFGLTGQLQLTSPAFIHQIWAADPILVTVAFVLLSAGILFKISAVPFHFWAPEVYATAPLPVIVLFSTAPKIASLGFFWHLIYAFAPVDGAFAWLCLVAGLTLTLGNLAALNQNHFRKLMAWSSIGQSGFLISALLSGTAIGRDAALLYSLFYAIANVTVFELIRLASKERQTDYLPALAGLGNHSKGALLWGIASLVSLLSLVGLPPTGGFTAKFLVFSALLEQYGTKGNYWVLSLLVLGLLNTVLALFYYLRIPYYLFLVQPAQLQQEANKIQQPTLLKTNLLVVILCLVLVLGFLKTDWLVNALQIRLHP